MSTKNSLDEDDKVRILGWLFGGGVGLFVIAMLFHNWLVFAVGVCCWAFVLVALFEPQYKDDEEEDSSGNQRG